MDDFTISLIVSAIVVSFACGGMASYWYWHYCYSRKLLRELVLAMVGVEHRASLAGRGNILTVEDRALVHITADYILHTR